jgi:predicted ATPase/DNA-binding CsgD family transcriptional regulator
MTVLLARMDRPTTPQGTYPAAPAEGVPQPGQLLDQLVASHGGVASAGRAAGGSLVATFPAAAEAVACALDLQRASLTPVRLAVCVHTGDTAGNGDLASSPDRAARLLELAHAGQILLSGAASERVRGCLPEGAWLTDLGSHRLADLGRAERVWQLCHPDVAVEFPPLRSLDSFSHNLPVQLTRFIGREAEMQEVSRLLADNRLVTLTGAGGSGKTRLALQVAADLLAEFPTGAWQVDLASLTDPALVPVAMARALGLPDEKGRSTVATVTGFIGAGRALVVVDNCEHLLEACAVMTEELLRACPGLSVVATSREPLGVAGEAIWRVPSLPLADDAVELFADRARRARPGFVITTDNIEAVAEICRRLDGMPLAIELAAARLRAFSVAEIAAGLHDRFRLLTGGSRTAVRRQQTLRASVDWSYALLTEPEQTVFRRLAAFSGGFDLEACLAVGADDGVDRHQVLNQLARLVDKSLVAAEESHGITRYRLLETIRQYALEKLSDSGEADTVRARHSDHYCALADRLDQSADVSPGGKVERLDADIDNLRAAFQWSLELSDHEAALRLACSLQRLWLGRYRLREGLAWFDAALAGDQAAEPLTPEVRARALADASVLDRWADGSRSGTLAAEAVALARQLGDPALLGRALAAAGSAAGYLYEDGRPSRDEAIVLARGAGDDRTAAAILGWQAYAAVVSGDLVAARSAAEEGLALARQAGNVTASRVCRIGLGWAMVMQGDLHPARSLLTDLVAETRADEARLWEMYGLAALGNTHALLGESEQARAAGEAIIVIADELGVAAYAQMGYLCVAMAAMASGDAGAMFDANQLGWRSISLQPEPGIIPQTNLALAELAAADLSSARQHADASVADATRLRTKAPLLLSLLASARVAAAAGEIDRAYDDAHQALIVGRGIRCLLGITDVLEILGGLPHSTEDQQKAARLLGAAHALRQKTGYQRYLLYQDGYDAAVLALRSSMGDAAFDQAFGDGADLTPDEAVNYALRGRGQRGRPATGWPSLTPAELDVARLVADGRSNKEIADKLFISPRTVQAHLTHIYGKLGITSRVQLAQQAARLT